MRVAVEDLLTQSMIRYRYLWSQLAPRSAIFNRAGRDRWPADRQQRVHASLREGRPDWYSIGGLRNLATGGREVDVFIYDEIGYFGITAQQFATEIAGLQVDTINLRLNSPGGEVFDGIAIYNVLREHRATVNVTVDGLAASIASVIAMAGDTVTMGRGSQMMIHEAHGLAIGNATVMRELADQLDRASDNIASFYAARTGGDMATWRAAMAAETWYSDTEAVAAGLADKVAGAQPDPGDGEARNTWDLRVFAHAGRQHAPAPQLPVTSSQSVPIESATGDPLDDVFAAWDPEQFKLLVTNVASNMPPIVTQPPTPVEPFGPPADDEWIIDPVMFHNALREGFTA